MVSILINRTRNRRRGAPQPHPFFSSVLATLPSNTKWAVACNAEFRVDGVGDLRGVLHHDGAILRFTTWGGAERFSESPMEFGWELTGDGSVHIVDRNRHSWFLQLRPLSEFVADVPPFAADGPLLHAELSAWMQTWAPERSTPLASPV